MEDESLPKIFQHLHKQESGEPDFEKEILLNVINKVVCLRSNLKGDSLKTMTKMDLETLRVIRKIEYEQN